MTHEHSHDPAAGPRHPWVPQPSAAGHPEGVEVLSDTTGTPVPPPRRSTRRVVALGVAGLMVVGVGGGVAWAAGQLSGGGAQPAEVLPADAVAYVVLDLDPSAGQKLAAAEFFRAFPDLRGRVSEDGDLRRDLFESVAPDLGLGELDWATEVEPWVGDRVGVALMPPAGAPEDAPATEPEFLVALQVTDEAAARATISDVGAASGGASPGLVIRDGYALMSLDQEVTERLSDAAAASNLGADADFAADMDSLGGRGIASLWVDLDAAGSLLSGALGSGLGGPELAEGLAGGVGGAGGDTAGVQSLIEEAYQGGLAATVRFDDGAVELVMQGNRQADTDLFAGEASVDLAGLPSSTAAAFGIANGEGALTTGWARWAEQMAALDSAGYSVEEMEQEVEEELGIAVPEDVAALLGSELLVALDREGLPDEPAVGARLTTDADRAESVLDRLESAVATAGGDEPPVVRARTDDGLVLASSEDYAARLGEEGGLGDSDVFADALPEQEDADIVVFADVSVFVELFADDLVAEDRETFDVLGGFGLTMSSDGEGSSRTVMRLSTR